MQGTRKLPSAAMIVAVAALVVALGGGAYAASKIGTSDIKSKAVTGPKIAGKAVKGTKIKADSIKSGKIKDGKVKAKKLDEDTQAELASIEGKQNACESGAVLAYAQVPADQSATFTPVNGFNCKGGTIEAKRTAVGRYEVRWQNFVFDDPTKEIVVQVTPVSGDGGTIAGYGTTAEANLSVDTYMHDGTDVDKLFSVTVLDAGPQE